MLQINSMLSFCKHDRYTGRCIYMYYFKQGNTAFYKLLNKSTPCPKILFCMRSFQSTYYLIFFFRNGG